MSHNKVALEQAAQEFVEATANPPCIYWQRELHRAWPLLTQVLGL